MGKGTLAGIDHLGAVDRILCGKRLGLMTNQTGVDARLLPTLDVLRGRYQVTALFAPEHGMQGSIQAGEPVLCAPDPDTGIMVHSCYGASHHLPPEALPDFDVFVFDMQDVGARFYTYLYSLSYAMADCAKANKAVVVLDRPNPLGGEVVQGTLLDERVRSFVGEYAMPTRYALTIGEYALWVRDHLKLNLPLHVAPLLGWHRDMLYDQTGLLFVPPSPNCATLHAARAYSGTCIFEGTNLSEGRGTSLPFEYIGAPFIDAAKLETRMNALHLPGVCFRRAHFTPGSGKHAGVPCAGVQIHLRDPHRANPFAAGLYLLDTVREMYPNELVYTGTEGAEFKTIDKLLGTDDYRRGRLDAKGLLDQHAPLIAAWREETRKYWLYQ
ncbi:MAG: DUF1343 domain-containing protein [Christensenellales bacterium]